MMSPYMIKEGGQIVMEGSEPVFNLTVLSKSGAVPTITNDATLAMYVYKNGSNATSTYTTGSMSVSGNIITTKTLTALVGGDELHVTIFGTVNGILDCLGEFPLTVRRKSGR